MYTFMHRMYSHFAGEEKGPSCTAAYGYWLVLSSIDVIPNSRIFHPL